MFDNLAKAKSYATRANAAKKLSDNKGAIPANATVFTVQRPHDDRWLAVIIYRDDLGPMNISFLLDRGICVVN